ncbi:Probable ABC transporter permease protein yurN [Listeria monocytogenes N53-1]|nr:Probable ABC transporter permease protein yurN [Listeria monocytogenes N53-1]
MKQFLNKNTPYLFISPALFLLLLFSLPILLAFVISFTDIDLVGLADYSKINFIGIDNYVNIMQDPVFLKSIFNTLFYVVIGVPLVIVCSLGIALMINFSQAKIFQFFRLIFYTPSITNVVAVAVVWSYLYNPRFGLLNYLLSFLDLGPVPWLQDPTIAKLSLIILAVWRAIGVNMIIFLAALQGIPREYYEAASLDGANSRQQLFKITVPMLRFNSNDNDWLVAILRGTVRHDRRRFIYQNGFQLSKFGYAAAGSFILFIAIIIITIIQFRIQRKNNGGDI